MAKRTASLQLTTDDFRLVEFFMSFVGDLLKIANPEEDISFAVDEATDTVPEGDQADQIRKDAALYERIDGQAQQRYDEFDQPALPAPDGHPQLPTLTSPIDVVAYDPTPDGEPVEEA